MYGEQLLDLMGIEFKANGYKLSRREIYRLFMINDAIIFKREK